MYRLSPPVLAASGVAGSGDDGESVPSTKRVVGRDTKTKDGAESGTICRGTSGGGGSTNTSGGGGGGD